MVAGAAAASERQSALPHQSMRDHDHPWTLPLIAWAVLSLILGLSTAQRVDWSQGWIGKAVLLVVLAPIAALLLLLLISVIGVGVMILFERVVLRRK
jgi:hypothetical protein